MENHITNKCEKERMFLEIKENRSYIFNPMGGKRLPWGSYYGLIVKIHSKMVLKIRLHIQLEESGFYGNVQIRKENHAVKDVPGHEKILVK